MKIGILYDDGGSVGLDLRRPDLGNPGVGGSQFCFLMLVLYYKKYYPNDQILLYHTNEAGNIYWDDIEHKHISDLNSFATECKKDGIDILLINFSRLKTLDKSIQDNQIKTIVWVHNFITGEFLKIAKKNRYVRRIVFVGKEQYDRYIDDDLIEKSECIFNMYNSECEEYTRNAVLAPVVTYTGAIVKGKGFHALAMHWKDVLESVPNAELYVIGSGKLYDRKAKMGSYGIATEEYEHEFMPYLTDDNGNILKSVHFCGILGSEKVDIYKKTKVGVINPTARTEICPLSAIEMEACGIPVVSKFKNGMPDVIENGVTGMLSYSANDFKKNLIKLLMDDSLNEQYSVNAKKYIAEKFAPERIIVQWNNTFNAVLNDKKPIFEKPTKNWNNNYKWIRVINRGVRKIFRFVPSVAAIECAVVNLLRRR